MARLSKAQRLREAANSLRYVRVIRRLSGIQAIGNVWTDIGTGSFADEKIYVVQTCRKIVQRCMLMTTDPGDLVLDPTCGSGTTAYVAEQWGRRWITIDTSRVALALARARIMGARYPYYLLADSPEGQRKEGEVTRTPPKETPTHGDIRQGFVYERVPHITLKSIANNAEIDVIWEKWQETLEPLRGRLNAALGLGASFETPAAQAPQDEGLPRQSTDHLMLRSAPFEGARLEARTAPLPRGKNGNPREAGRTGRTRRKAAWRVVGSADCAAEGNRRLDRRQGRVRIPLRQALSRQFAHPRRRPVHGREPVAASGAGGR